MGGQGERGTRRGGQGSQREHEREGKREIEGKGDGGGADEL